MVKLSIIVLSFNTKDLTVSCVASIIRQYKTQLENGEFEIIVVDNASTDATTSEIRNKTIQLLSGREFEARNIKVIENKENYGFAKGNNIGTKHASGQYVFFLNSDTQMLDRGLISMIDFFDRHKNIGIIGAKFANSDGSAQASTGIFYNLPALVLMLLGVERFGLLRQNPLRICQVDWVSGGAMLTRKDLFEKLEGFDENFFMYVEDMELCFRAKKEGFATYFYPQVTIAHKQLGSSNRAFAIVNIYKGLLYFYKKHTNYLQYTLVKLLLIVKAYIAITIGMLTHNRYLTSTYRNALSF